ATGSPKGLETATVSGVGKAAPGGATWPSPRTTARTKPRDSKAPMSGAPPWGRGTPRWSVIAPGPAAPASRAGPPGRGGGGGGGGGLGEGGSAGVGERAEERVGVEQVGGVERDARRIGEEVVARRGDGTALVVGEVAARAVGEEAVDDRQPA